MTTKLYVGCGPDRKDGYIGCDIRKTPATTTICSAWEISQHYTNVDEIYTRHMVEHLTFKELEHALEDWYNALKVGGKVLIIIPDMDFHIKQWNDAVWNDEEMKERTSNARWGAAGFWGWQNECDPKAANYNNTYWDVHKSGHNIKSLTYFLEKANFKDVKRVKPMGQHLSVGAYK